VRLWAICSESECRGQKQLLACSCRKAPRTLTFACLRASQQTLNTPPHFTTMGIRSLRRIVIFTSRSLYDSHALSLPLSVPSWVAVDRFSLPVWADSFTASAHK